MGTGGGTIYNLTNVFREKLTSKSTKILNLNFIYKFYFLRNKNHWNYARVRAKTNQIELFAKKKMWFPMFLLLIEFHYKAMNVKYFYRLLESTGHVTLN